MPKTAFYAVQKGRNTGIFLSWDECEPLVKGFVGATYKKFNNRPDAEKFVAMSAEPVAIQGTKRALSPVEADSHVVYCDGACKGNGQLGSIAGIGVWWGPDDPRNIAERCPGGQTNNRAELIAIARVLESTPITSKALVIKTDSKYSIDCFQTWLPNWQRNNFRSSKGEPVKNAPLIRYVAALLHNRSIQGQKVKLVHVKGHAGIQGNEGADAQANLGATLPAVEERDWQQLEQDLSRKDKFDPVKTPVQLEVKTQEPQSKKQRTVEISPEELQLYAQGIVDDDDLEKDFED